MLDLQTKRVGNRALAERAEPGYLAAGEEAARERYFTWDEPKAARELSRAALEMNCRVSPVPFLLAS
jgi:hypothetical protein